MRPTHDDLFWSCEAVKTVGAVGIFSDTDSPDGRKSCPLTTAVDPRLLVLSSETLGPWGGRGGQTFTRMPMSASERYFAPST